MGDKFIKAFQVLLRFRVRFSVVFSFPISKGSGSLDKISVPLRLGLQIRSPPFVLSTSDENLFGLASGKIGNSSSSVFIFARDLRRTLCRTNEDEEWTKGTGEVGGDKYFLLHRCRIEPIFGE